MWSAIMYILLSLGFVPSGSVLSDYQKQQIALQNQSAVQNQIIINLQTGITKDWDIEVINP